MSPRPQQDYPLRAELWEVLDPIVQDYIHSTLQRCDIYSDRIDRMEICMRRLERRIDTLTRHNEILKGQLRASQEELRKTQQDLQEAMRAARRQAAPFARGTPKERPKKPGQKRGHAPAWRRPPAQVDETIELTMDRCPACKAFVKSDRVDEQFVEDIPPVRPVVRRFLVHSAYCKRCRRRVYAPHPDRVSEARGSAAAHVGSRATALAADLKHRLAVPFRKTADIFGRHFGLRVTAGGLVHATARLAERMKPVHEALLDRLRSSAVVHADETGWRIGGWPAWLWVFTNRDLTLYAIRRSRGQDVVRETLGEDFGGVLVTDFLATYDPLPYRKGKCAGHLIRELSDLLKFKKGACTVFLRKLLRLFRRALVVKARKEHLSPPAHRGQVTIVEKRLNGLLLGNYTDRDNKRLAERLRKQRHHVFTFLYHDDVDATNNHAERQIRPAVIVRKISACNRTVRGAGTHEVLASVIATCCQQAVAFTDLAAAVFAGSFTGQLGALTLRGLGAGGVQRSPPLS